MAQLVGHRIVLMIERPSRLERYFRGTRRIVPREDD